MLIKNQQMTEAELMMQARRNLDRRLLEAPAIREALVAPEPPRKIYTPEQQERRMRSLRACHLPSLYKRPRHPKPKDTGAYVPPSAARLENDRNLTDGARRCARKLMEETHRRDRRERTLQVTVSYLAKGLGRCRRTVQRYLGMLEREGYIRVQVMAGVQSRMCIGLIVKLLPPLFPRHQREAWPEKIGNPPNPLTDEAENRRNPDATRKSQNESQKFFFNEETGKWEKEVDLVQCLIEKEIQQAERFPYLYSYHTRFRAMHEPRCRAYSRADWAEKCMAGICRALIRAIPRPWCVEGLHLPEAEGSAMAL
jgi:hypothetical protein